MANQNHKNHNIKTTVEPVPKNIFNNFNYKFLWISQKLFNIFESLLINI